MPRTIFPIAHRGASAYAPENTLAAFERALALGAKHIQFDLRLSADSIPIVLHDPTLNRTTNATGPVTAYTAAHLQTLDAGSWFNPAFADQRLPTLDQALEVICPHARPVIELKTPLRPDRLTETLLRHRALASALVISANPAWLTPLRASHRDYRIGLLAGQWTDDLPARAQSLGAEVLALDVALLNIPRISTTISLGLEVWCYTANDVGLVAACSAMGATGIITDHPDLIRDKT